MCELSGECMTRATRAWTNDERRARWAYRYFSAGLHRAPIADCPQPESPWKPTVAPRQPAPLAGLVRTGDSPTGAPDAGSQASGNFSTLAEWEAYERGDAPMPTLPPF